MDQTDRNAVLAEQRQLVRALVNNAGASTVVGFDAERLELAARMLRNKRFRAVRKAYPGLFRRFGQRGAQEFDLYARAAPLPSGGAMADAVAFARRARRRPELSLALRWSLFMVEITSWRRSRPNHQDEGA